MHPRTFRADLLLLITAAIWGSAFVAQRLGMNAVGPMLYTGLRFTLGALAILPLALLLKEGRPPRRPLSRRGLYLAGATAGVLLFLGASLQQVGLLYTSVANAGFITGLYVVLVPLIGLLLGQRPHAGIWLGAGLAITGLYLLSVGDGFTIASGDALQLIGAVFWALHVLLLDAVARRTHAVRLACLQFATCALLSMIAAVLFETIDLAAIRVAAPAIAYGGLLSVGLAYTLQVVAQKDAIASHAAIILSMEAVFAALAGWLVLGETLTVRALAGCTLMLAGMLAAQLIPLMRRTRS
ncbi:threonine/homoserine efflux transporter RhtA [Plasticicumulans lactativorans]|uniref:Threonine/homoserine efflux transporter RhtA n=1 Tax=Plasticicumulans lactativorans TaxID=1133106 RepID=A0A4R2LM02_9GAMM|nr:DMT family transporter [Plasticicumulans lactativorans]TCO80465.1 threonine/homoserine efflux transporter RhtA [Plasticicumulans lactativorans]